MDDSETAAKASEVRHDFPPFVYVPTTSEDDPATRRVLMQYDLT